MEVGSTQAYFFHRRLLKPEKGRCNLEPKGFKATSLFFWPRLQTVPVDCVQHHPAGRGS